MIAPDGAAEAVLSSATALGGLLGVSVEARHAGATRITTASAARGAGVRVEDYPERTPEELADAAFDDDVAAIVLGAQRRRFHEADAAGAALEVAMLQGRPVVSVPAAAPARRTIRSVLAPLDGAPQSARALGRLVELVRHAGRRVVLAHVHRPEELPPLDDHPPHEVWAWREELRALSSPWCGDAPHELRVGDPAEQLLELVAQRACDLVALAWHQDLSRGRAALVRAILERSPVPVMLVPAWEHARAFADVAPPPRAAAPAPATARAAAAAPSPAAVRAAAAPVTAAR